MALSKRPRSSHWQYDFTVDGKRYRGTTGVESKMAAKAFEANLMVEIQNKGFRPQPQQRSATLLTYIPRFKDWVDRNQLLKPKSQVYYNDGIKVLSRSTLAHVPIGVISKDLIDTTEFREVSGSPASPHLSNQALSTLRRLFNKAKEWGDLKDIPHVRLREATGRSAIVTVEVEDKLLKRLQKPERHPRVLRDRETLIDVYLLIHDGGMRTSEAVAALIENIDWAGKRLWNPGGKSKKAKRWIPLSDRLLERLAARCKGRTQGWVFPSPRGSKSGHLESPRKGFRQACRDEGISDEIVLYSGRHTFGTFAFAATKNTFAVGDAMGHQDIKSMRPYQHHDTAEIAAVLNRRNESRHTLRHTEVSSARNAELSGSERAA